ncbi:MAG: hypothetical protein IH888_04280, partial [Planctomycetes bacterium]|nr:hypothetical protein [Planctomycetota bacterium]
LSATAVNFQSNSITTTGGGSLTGTWTDLGSVTTIDINGGSVYGTAIGASLATTIIGTTIDATTDFTVGTLVITDDTLTFGGAALLSIAAATATGLRISDGAVDYLLVDTRVASSGVTAHTFSNANIEFANVASSSFTQVGLTAYTLNVTTDAVDITGAFATMLSIPAASLTSATVSTNYTAIISSVTLVGPTAGTNVILDHMAALHITDGGGGAGTETLQSGIAIDTLAGGGTNYAITIGSTDVDQNLIHVGVTGDPIFSWSEASDQFAFSHRVAILDGGANTLVLGDATTAVLHINNQNDSTDAAGGIVFGSSGDTNLYRSAANTLRTDDTFVSADFSLLNDWRMTESEKLGLPAGFSIIPYENAKHAVFTINRNWFELYETRVTHAQWDTLVAVPDRVEVLEKEVAKLKTENEELRKLVEAGSDG